LQFGLICFKLGLGRQGRSNQVKLKKDLGLYFGLGLGPHLFVKVPRPADSEVTFAVLGIRVKLPPFTTSLTTQR